MKYAFLVSTLCLGLCGCQSVLQPPPAVAQPSEMPTMLAPVNRSLADLLDDGWIIAGSGGPLLFTLHKDNKWITCAADDAPDTGHGPTSQCMALN
ncbi:MAG TPA: hypothetical protein VHO91_04715 [Rhodopila sp.]|nr:hypothetical protein [Rhodopila sp.]